MVRLDPDKDGVVDYAELAQEPDIPVELPNEPGMKEAGYEIKVEEDGFKSKAYSVTYNFSM